MTRLTVHAEPESMLHGHIPETLATLPESLRLTRDQADIIAVFGSAGWTHRVLSSIRSGVRGVMTNGGLLTMSPNCWPVTGSSIDPSATSHSQPLRTALNRA